MICIIDYDTCSERGVEPAAAAALCANAGAAILVRAKRQSLAVQRAFFGESVQFAIDSGTLCLISGAPELAIDVGADGAHMPANGPRFERTDERLLCGRSTHSIAEVERAAEEGFDYVFLSPVFDSSSKAGLLGRGLGFLRSATRVSPIPVIALGGILPERVEHVRAAGGYGVAALGSFASARAGVAAAELLRASRRAGGVTER